LTLFIFSAKILIRMEGAKQRSKKWRCQKRGCGQLLAEVIDKNRIRILGPSGQSYELGILYAEIKCPKCGTLNYAETKINRKLQKGNIAVKKGLQPLRKEGATSIFALSQKERNKLRNELTEHEWSIYKILSGGDIKKAVPLDAWREAEEYRKQMAFPKKIFQKKLRTILKKVLELKGVDTSFLKD